MCRVVKLGNIHSLRVHSPQQTARPGDFAKRKVLLTVRSGLQSIGTPEASVSGSARRAYETRPAVFLSKVSRRRLSLFASALDNTAGDAWASCSGRIGHIVVRPVMDDYGSAVLVKELAVEHQERVENLDF